MFEIARRESLERQIRRILSDIRNVDTGGRVHYHPGTDYVVFQLLLHSLRLLDVARDRGPTPQRGLRRDFQRVLKVLSLDRRRSGVRLCAETAVSNHDPAAAAGKAHRHGGRQYRSSGALETSRKDVSLQLHHQCRVHRDDGDSLRRPSPPAAEHGELQPAHPSHQRHAVPVRGHDQDHPRRAENSQSQFGEAEKGELQFGASVELREKNRGAAVEGRSSIAQRNAADENSPDAKAVSRVDESVGAHVGLFLAHTAADDRRALLGLDAVHLQNDPIDNGRERHHDFHVLPVQLSSLSDSIFHRCRYGFRGGAQARHTTHGFRFCECSIRDDVGRRHVDLLVCKWITNPVTNFTEAALGQKDIHKEEKLRPLTATPEYRARDIVSIHVAVRIVRVRAGQFATVD
ncbi:unnamed protein product [Trichogramma brassicae]|uniref:Uncharacterized protein n=1 Tax=Trichogramma brassicae TaxID=86971 RepID=A0A6H5J2Y2_9HYME|nr:unnamed protein product [Trichogramma brassicae]